MKKAFCRKIISLSLITLMCFLFGCAPTGAPLGTRLYSGEPLPRQEIALIIPLATSGGSLRINWVRDEKDKQIKDLYFNGRAVEFELVPGQYAICVSSFTQISNPATIYKYTGKPLILGVNAKANHVYIITYQIVSDTQWEASLTDLEVLDSLKTDNVKEFDKLDIAQKALFLSKDLREKLTKGIEEYFQRKRLAKIPTPKGWR
ncbi:MAG: hypothetical protein Q8R88_14775 [Desulfoprunum sp.]|nr:hypothetical protein [Desulfoprunum sp.]